MKPKGVTNAVVVATLMLIVSMGLAVAQDPLEDDELDATMRLMEHAEAELPEAVTKKIQLPEHLREDSTAADNSAKGHSQANAAREDREKGPGTADDARERGNDMSEAAKENRENRGRSGDRPDPPNRPEVPNPGGQTPR